MIFVVAVDTQMPSFTSLCQEERLGFKDQDFWMPILAFADNICLLPAHKHKRVYLDHHARIPRL